MGSISKLIVVLICSVFGSYLITKLLQTISIKSRQKALMKNEKEMMATEFKEDDPANKNKTASDPDPDQQHHNSN